jgi:hypothetical protein
MRRFGAAVDGVTRLPTVTASTSLSGSMSPQSGAGSARCARARTAYGSSWCCSRAITTFACRMPAYACLDPNQVTTPIGHRFSPEQTITVLDPRHPLCGRTLPLVALTHHAQLGRCCVVWLRPHVERLIPVQATNLAFDPTDISPSPLSLAAVEQLLRVFHDLQHASQGVSSDARPSRPSCAPPQARRPDCAPSAVEPPVRRPTTARPTGAHRRRATVDSPSAEPTPN